MSNTTAKLRRNIFVKLLMREHRLGYLNRPRLCIILRAIKSQSTDVQARQMTRGSFRLALIWAMWQLADESPVIFTWGLLSLIPAAVITVYVILSRLAERI
jgi:hypothetical protein